MEYSPSDLLAVREVHYNFALLQLDRGQGAAALASLEKLHGEHPLDTLAPASSEVIAARCAAFLYLNELDNAQAMVEALGGDHDPWAMYLQAYVCARLRDYPSAAELFGRVWGHGRLRLWSSVADLELFPHGYTLDEAHSILTAAVAERFWSSPLQQRLSDVRYDLGQWKEAHEAAVFATGLGDLSSMAWARRARSAAKLELERVSAVAWERARELDSTLETLESVRFSPPPYYYVPIPDFLRNPPRWPG